MKTLLAAAAIALFTTQASAQTKWNLPSAYPNDNPHVENLNAFAKDVSDATGGKLQIAVHGGASLFKGPEIKRAVATGQAQAELEEYKRRSSNPMVQLEFFHKDKDIQQDLEFHLCSNLTAYNVQIQPIIMPKSTATFSEITKVPVGAWEIVKPVIDPVVDPTYRHDFVVMLHNQPEEFIDEHRTPESVDLPEPVVSA
jgi:hypothetical protein